MTERDQSVIRLLENLIATVDQHIASEESALVRIERLLDGNGQPGLLREHSSHAAKLSQLEQWKGQLATERRWLIGLLVTVALALLGIAIAFIQKR